MVTNMDHHVVIATVLALFFVIASAMAENGAENSPFNVKKLKSKFKADLPFTRIVGGADAIPHEFPSAARILHASTGTTACSGSIVDREWILTAGHCMVQPSGPSFHPSQLKVVVGEHHADQKEENEQLLDVKRVIPHEKYFTAKHQFRYDIGLLQVTPPIRFGKTVSPSNLPACNDYEPGEVIKTGWGANFSEPGKPHQFPKVLKKLYTKTVSDEECRKSTDEIEIPRTSMCSFQDGESTCPGDSGGPVYKLINNITLIQVGLNAGFVTDTYENICHKEISVSTKISPFVGWIHRRIQGCGNYPLRPVKK